MRQKWSSARPIPRTIYSKERQTKPSQIYVYTRNNSTGIQYLKRYWRNDSIRTTFSVKQSEYYIRPRTKLVWYLSLTLRETNKGILKQYALRISCIVCLFAYYKNVGMLDAKYNCYYEFPVFSLCPPNFII